MSALLLLLACAEDRALLSVPVHFEAAAASVQVDAPVEIQLTTATLSLGGLLFEGPAQTAARWSFPLVSRAWAHPGHDFAGDVAGELAGSWTLDLLADAELGDARCYEGDYATARLTLAPSPETILEGTARVADVDRAFRFVLAPDQEVTGIPFETTMSAAEPPDGLSLTVDLAHALSYADWSTEDTDGDGLLTTADGAFGNTVLFGILSTPTFIIGS
jgi:hypothetical protein